MEKVHITANPVTHFNWGEGIGKTWALARRIERYLTFWIRMEKIREEKTLTMIRNEKNFETTKAVFRAKVKR